MTIYIYIGVFFDVFPRWEQCEKGNYDLDYHKAIAEWNDRAEIGCTHDNQLDFQVFATLMHEMMPDMGLTPSDDTDFPLEHADLGVHNIFIDEDFNITCIIDWSLWSSVPLVTLITHAPLPSRSHDIGEAERGAFERGFEEEELKRD